MAVDIPREDATRGLYQKAAGSILRSLSASYTTKGANSNGLLRHGVYCKAKPGKSGWGDDECCIWGDYFYLEGLMRLKQDWRAYW